MQDRKQNLRWYGPIPAAVLDQLTDPKRTFGIVLAQLGTVGSVRACGCQERGMNGVAYLAPCANHAGPAVTQMFAQTALPMVLRDGST